MSGDGPSDRHRRQAGGDRALENTHTSNRIIVLSTGLRGDGGSRSESLAPDELRVTALSDISPRTGTTDRRYRTKRWQKVRLRVLNRDRWICRIAERCPERASVCDHIEPVYPGMPDALFFGESNLRAGCRTHNLARTAEKLTPDETPPAIVTRDYSK